MYVAAGEFKCGAPPIFPLSAKATCCGSWPPYTATPPSTAEHFFTHRRGVFASALTYSFLSNRVRIMRLLKCNSAGEFSLTNDFISDDIPRYAILSHTWEADTEEVTFQDLIYSIGEDKTGYNKIRFCGEQSVAQTGTRDTFRQFARYVVQFRYNGTSNPLAKLYGLLGLVPEAVGLCLNPKYDEDALSMYRCTAEQIIRSSQSLYILSQVHNISFEETTFAAELPSWVPDWTAKPYLDQE